jgi:hypothetical protein
VPIHLVGANVPIDRRSEHVVGASRTSPHGLVQEFLNRRDDALWGIVSNGKTLRLLRDSVRLSRPAYIEFDLAAIFEGGAFADFALFWLVCHQSRFEPFQSERIEDCALERWSKAADEEGTRVLDGLRDGVRAAIEDLGRGFLAHPSNTRLRDALRDGRLAPQAYYRQLLRAAYRLIFQAVAEDRGLLQDPNADAAARGRYTAWYSLSRVRRLAEKRRGSRHDDLWRMVKVVWRLLGDDRGGPALALPALGSFLWSDAAVPDIIGAELTNAAFLDAIHHLAFAIDGNTRRAVDFEHLGAEELGSVYESLLELHPELHLDDARFDLIAAAGNDRKSTGSYYTPDALVQCLLDSALEPVLEAIVRADDRRPLADRLLAVKVCDPACGSGHFLIAAAHRIAKRVAQARTGDDEPAPADHRQALRDVIGRCLFGVDKNEMAVELCKVSLWLESLTSGQPLSFLDDRILVGDALLGATPALLRQPLPAEAFDAIGDDDKALARNLKAKNRDETLKQKNGDEAAKGSGPVELRGRRSRRRRLRRPDARSSQPRRTGRPLDRGRSREGSRVSPAARLPRIPQGTPRRGRMVRGIRVAEEEDRTRGPDDRHHPRTRARRGRAVGRAGAHGRAPAAAVRVLPLVRRVPTGVRGEGGRGARVGRGMGGWVRLRARESAVGAREAAGAGVLRVEIARKDRGRRRTLPLGES